MSGFLEVGVDLRNEVVINLPRDMTGHLTFSPDQARNLAELLIRKAAEADGQAVDGRPIRAAEGDRQVLADALMSLLAGTMMEGFRFPKNVHVRIRHWAARRLDGIAPCDPERDVAAAMPIIDLLAGVPT